MTFDIIGNFSTSFCRNTVRISMNYDVRETSNLPKRLTLTKRGSDFSLHLRVFNSNSFRHTHTHTQRSALGRDELKDIKGAGYDRGGGRSTARSTALMLPLLPLLDSLSELWKKKQQNACTHTSTTLLISSDCTFPPINFSLPPSRHP